jgi:hypothetical protein
MMLEVGRSWSMPCDAPLTTFVLVVASFGMIAALVDFAGEVFKDPMPPMTKLEQSRAKEERKAKLTTYAWLLAIILVWGALGAAWVHGSDTCAHTAPGIYRLALLLSFCWLIFVALIVLVVAALAIDFCLSGKLRMVLILEQ